MSDIYDAASREIMSRTNTSDNAYEHARALLDSDEESEIFDFQSILTKELKLANIADGVQLRLQQNSAEILVMGLSAALREDALLPLIKTWYWTWKCDLGATRGYKGKERSYQGGPGVATRVTGPMTQPGLVDMPSQEQEENPDEGSNFFQKLFNRKRGNTDGSNNR